MASDLLNGSFQDGNFYKGYILTLMAVLFVFIITVSKIVF